MYQLTDLDGLDETNRLLLRELHADPRITMSALARKVGMSAPAVTERVQRMQRSGVIKTKGGPAGIATARP